LTSASATVGVLLSFKLEDCAIEARKSELYREALLENCEQRDVALEVYSPLGTRAHVNDMAPVGYRELGGGPRWWSRRTLRYARTPALARLLGFSEWS
jgi:hypothetical protein